MGLRLDEQSSALTTFLTPSGSYQWISLPTGTANSPAYFTDSMNKKLYTSLPIIMPKPSALKTRPPNILQEGKLLRFTKEKCT
jgi:hypothetical protein